jgi:hypothetical protein
MIKNPYLNAFFAAAYIVVLVSVAMTFGAVIKADQPILDPMIMLSTLVLSVALMAVLFFYTPAKMFLDNQRDAALSFFMKELGTFACFVLVLVLLLVVV